MDAYEKPPATADIVGAGSRIPIGEGGKAYVPLPLPAPVELAGETAGLLTDAGIAVGTLKGLTHGWADALDMRRLAFLLARQEAVFSSGIEGTSSTVSDVLRRDAELPSDVSEADLAEVYNHVLALEHAFETETPLSLRLLRDLHRKLVRGSRGGDKAPGEFRRIQVRIGGTSFEDATYVPPPRPQMLLLLDDFEHELQLGGQHPLVQAGLLHAQFELIHPFMDGNGRVGRMLIILLLRAHGLMPMPLMNMSWYFKQFQSEYYARLGRISSHGDWQGWTQFFLRGVEQVANHSASMLEAIVDLQRRNTAVVDSQLSSRFARPLLELLLRRPFVTTQLVAGELSCSEPSARALLDDFTRHGIIVYAGGLRPREYVYLELVRLLS